MNSNQAGKDVLIAEDDLDDYYFFEEAIKEITISIGLRHAKDGQMLFEKLNEAIPDLLFLDIEMPCKNGVSCLLEIRKDPKYNQMPVVMFTAHNSQSYIKNTYQNGANFFLIKPASIQSLVEKLRNIFSMQWDKQLYFPSLNDYVLSS